MTVSEFLLIAKNRDTTCEILFRAKPFSYTGKICNLSVVMLGHTPPRFASESSFSPAERFFCLGPQAPGGGRPSALASSAQSAPGGQSALRSAGRGPGLSPPSNLGPETGA